MKKKVIFSSVLSVISALASALAYETIQLEPEDEISNISYGYSKDLSIKIVERLSKEGDLESITFCAKNANINEGYESKVSFIKNALLLYYDHRALDTVVQNSYLAKQGYNQLTHVLAIQEPFKRFDEDIPETLKDPFEIAPIRRANAWFQGQLNDRKIAKKTYFEQRTQQNIMPLECLPTTFLKVGDIYSLLGVGKNEKGDLIVLRIYQDQKDDDFFSEIGTFSTVVFDSTDQEDSDYLLLPSALESDEICDTDLALQKNEACRKRKKIEEEDSNADQSRKLAYNKKSKKNWMIVPKNSSKGSKKSCYEPKDKERFLEDLLIFFQKETLEGTTLFSVLRNLQNKGAPNMYTIRSWMRRDKQKRFTVYFQKSQN